MVGLAENWLEEVVPVSDAADERWVEAEKGWQVEEMVEMGRVEGIV